MSNKPDLGRITKFIFFSRLGLQLVFIFIVVNIGLVAVIRYFILAQAACIPASQIATDARCLYTFNNKVFEKGTHANPHQAHPCGMDVTAIMPASHVADVAYYLDPNYKGDICTSAPTPNPTPVATPNPTPAPVTPPPANPPPGNPPPPPAVNPTPHPTATPGTGGALPPPPPPTTATKTPAPTPAAVKIASPVSKTVTGSKVATPIPTTINPPPAEIAVLPPPAAAAAAPPVSQNPDALVIESTKWLVYAMLGLIVITTNSWIMFMIWDKLKSLK